MTAQIGEFALSLAILAAMGAILTSLAAAHMGLRDRGRITPGSFADLVLFDPQTILDRATPQEPHATSVGIARVWVNGQEVYSDGKTTGAKPGRILTRE